MTESNVIVLIAFLVGFAIGRGLVGINPFAHTSTEPVVLIEREKELGSFWITIAQYPTMKECQVLATAIANDKEEKYEALCVPASDRLAKIGTANKALNRKD